jgi:hypothetical protein
MAIASPRTNTLPHFAVRGSGAAMSFLGHARGASRNDLMSGMRKQDKLNIAPTEWARDLDIWAPHFILWPLSVFIEATTTITTSGLFNYGQGCGANLTEPQRRWRPDGAGRF